MSGFGGSPYGGSPYGGATPLSSGSAPAAFDTFCFTDDDSSIASILLEPTVTSVDAGTQIFTDATPSLILQSAFVSAAPGPAELYVTGAVGNSWTFEFELDFDALPPNFSNLANEHIFISVQNANGPCAGFFFSKTGIAYAGAAKIDSGALQLLGGMAILPGTADDVSEGELWTYRIAVSASTGAVYLFGARSADLVSSAMPVIAILPVIDASDLSESVSDRAAIFVSGTASNASRAQFRSLCLASTTLIANTQPIADPGPDQAVRICSIVQLDGSGSFDPEGAPLSYSWRLIDVPLGSSFAHELADGATLPESPATGFTNRFFSSELAIIDGADPLQVGDVLLVRGQAYSIIGTGVSPSFHVLLASQELPDDISGAEPFKIIRQNSISGTDTVSPSFYPDVVGFFKFDLTVNDGGLDSAPVELIVSVQDSPLPRGCLPDATFLWNYLSDFWGLVEGKERLDTFFSGVAQVAAAELLTLWQHDYSKSLRDIQRTFRRKWLHYDPLLPEPIPELTNIRLLWGGVELQDQSTAGKTLVGSSLVISSSAFEEDLEITITGANPITPTILAAQIQAALNGVSDAFTVSVIDQATGDQTIRINATVPFTIEEPSVAFPPGNLLAGASNDSPSGTGSGIGTNTYKVDRSLEGLGITGTDFLCLGGEAYRIARIVDDPADEFRYQRIVLLDDIPLPASSTWTIGSYVTSQFMNFYQGLVVEDDYVYLEVTDINTDDAFLVEARALGASAVKTDTLVFATGAAGRYLSQPDLYTTYLAKLVRRSFVPVSSLVVSIPYLSETIQVTDDEATLRENLDFFITSFRNQPCAAFAVAVWEDEVPPDRLWAENTYLDNRPTIEANFGVAAEFTLEDHAELPDTVDYLSAVRGLWYSYFHGPTLYNLRVGSQILLGLPFAEQPGTILEIRTDFSATQGRVLVQDEDSEVVRSYTFPKALSLETNPATGAPYAEGDTIAQFAPLTSGVEVVDWKKDPTWFEGLLNQGLFFEVEKFHKFLVEVSAEVFDLEALLFVQSFIKKIKPTYTFPLFLVSKTIGDTEIDVTDEVTMTLTMKLLDATCSSAIGSGYRFDQIRGAVGGARNIFDHNIDPLDPDPTYPAVDDPIEWGFDKDFLCPEDIPVVEPRRYLDGATAISDAIPFNYGRGVDSRYETEDLGVFSVPAGAVGVVLNEVYVSAISHTGTLDRAYVEIWGDPAGDPTDYEMVIAINSVEQEAIAFTAGEYNAYAEAAISVAVTAGDAIQISIRSASGAVERNPNWPIVRTRVYQDEVVGWLPGDTPPEGVYSKADEVVSYIDYNSLATYDDMRDGFRADLLITHSSKVVQTVTSVEGGGNDFEQSTVGDRPDWVSVNGRAGIEFNGSTDHMIYQGGFPKYLHDGTGGTLLFTWDVAYHGIAQTGVFFDTNGFNAASVGFLLYFLGTPTNSIRLKVGDGSGVWSVDEAAAFSTPAGLGYETHVISYRLTAARAVVRVDGVDVIDVAPGNLSSSNPAGTLYMGSTILDSFHAVGAAKEWLLFDKALSDSNLAILENQMIARYS